MIKTNYHSHSTFCDGKSTMEEMVVSAVNHGFTHWGVSSHAPVDFPNKFALKKENFNAYKQEFYRLKEKYHDKIKLYFGLETDYITDMMEDNRKQAEQYGLEYFISSVHQVKEHNSSQQTWFIDGHDIDVYDKGLRELFDMDIKRAVTCFYRQQINMLEKNRPDVIGHFDKVVMNNKGRYFSADEKWYKDLVMSLIETIEKYGTIVEVNTRGLYKRRNNDFYPDSDTIKILVDKKIPMTVSTDCHNADETDAYYKEALELLKSLNCKELVYFEDGWKTACTDDFL